MAFDLKQFINQSRQQGIPDEATYKYLEGKNLLPQTTGGPTQGGFGSMSLSANNFKATTPPTSGHIGQLGTTLKNALPVAGAIGGGLVGGAVGLAVGGPVGAWAGGAVGSGLGAAAGEAGKEFINKAQGQQNAISPSSIAQTGLTYGALDAIGGPVLSAVGKGLEGIGGVVFKSAIPTSAKEAVWLQAYKADKPFIERFMNVMKGVVTKGAPTTVADTAFNKGLAGTEGMIGVQGKKAADTLWKDFVSPQLKKSTVKVDIQEFFNLTEKQIIKDTPEKSRQSSLLDALQAMKDDYKGVGKVSLFDLQNFKEGWAKFVPEKAYKGQPIAGAFNDVKNILSGNARKKIYGELGQEVKQAYIDWGNLQGVQELGQKAMTGGGLKGGAGSWINTVWHMSLTPIATVGGRKVLYKTGQGIEFLGQPGLRFVRDLFVAPLIQSDPSGTTNPDQSQQSTNPPTQ